MSIFDKINDKESYYGEVVDVSDETKSSRIKVKVVSVFDEIPTEVIPWAIPRYIDNSSHDLPALGEIVQVKFLNNDKYFPTWYRIRKTSESLSDEDYETGSILFEKNLEKYGLDGSISVRWTESEGLVYQLIRSDNDSKIIVRNDNTVVLKNGNTERSVHLSNDTIVIGSEDEGQQPATVGDDNVSALEKLNDTIDSLVTIMNTNLTALSTASQSNPMTAPLAPVFQAYASQAKTQIKALHTQNKQFFPETLSNVVTLDKT